MEIQSLIVESYLNDVLSRKPTQDRRIQRSSKRDMQMIASVNGQLFDVVLNVVDKQARVAASDLKETLRSLNIMPFSFAQVKHNSTGATLEARIRSLETKRDALINGASDAHEHHDFLRQLSATLKGNQSVVNSRMRMARIILVGRSRAVVLATGRGIDRTLLSMSLAIESAIALLAAIVASFCQLLVTLLAPGALFIAAAYGLLKIILEAPRLLCELLLLDVVLLLTGIPLVNLASTLMTDSMPE